MMSFLLGAHGWAYASVNLQTAGWFWKIDLHELEVTYNSRSLHQGWWGQGWCSDLDVKLQQVTQSSVQFIRCSQKENAFIEPLPSGYKVNFKRRNFYFNKNFQLEKVKTKAGLLRLSWNENHLSRLEINGAGYEVSVEGGRIARLSRAEESWDFLYQGSLLKKFFHGKLRESYSYDRFDNLSEINGNSSFSGTLLISYDQNDRVTRVKTPDHCSSSYVFTEFKKNAELFLLSTVERKCPFQNSSTSKSLLSRFEVDDGRTLTLTQVNEVTL